MPDALVGLLPYLPGLPMFAAFLWIYRLWIKAQRQHEQAEGKVDAERKRRRKVETEMDKLEHRNRELEAEVKRLRGRGDAA